MVQIDQLQEKSIATTFNVLTRNGDDKNDDISRTLLLIYTPVTSGLVFLSTNLNLVTSWEKLTFLGLVLTSALIVLSILLEKLGHYLIASTIGKTFANHVAKTGNHTQGPLYGKEWQHRLVTSQIFIKFSLSTVNVIFVIAFVVLMVI